MPKLMIVRNPWFSLGFHIDHKRPLVEFHLPFMIIRFGWNLHKPAYSKNITDNTWILSWFPIEKDRRDYIRLKWLESGGE